MCRSILRSAAALSRRLFSDSSYFRSVAWLALSHLDSELHRRRSTRSLQYGAGLSHRASPDIANSASLSMLITCPGGCLLLAISASTPFIGATRALHKHPAHSFVFGLDIDDCITISDVRPENAVVQQYNPFLQFRNPGIVSAFRYSQKCSFQHSSPSAAPIC